MCRFLQKLHRMVVLAWNQAWALHTCSVLVEFAFGLLSFLLEGIDLDSRRLDSQATCRCWLQIFVHLLLWLHNRSNWLPFGSASCSNLLPIDFRTCSLDPRARAFSFGYGMLGIHAQKPSDKSIPYRPRCAREEPVDSIHRSFSLVRRAAMNAINRLLSASLCSRRAC